VVHLLLNILLQAAQKLLILADLEDVFIEFLYGLENKAILLVLDEFGEGGEVDGENWDSCPEHIDYFHGQVEA
jgi:hypothetical protein